MGNGNDTCSLAFFKNLVIQQETGPCRGAAVNVFPHSLSSDVLFTIKHFQIGIRSIEPQIKFIEAHPEYYKSNCLQFEQL